MTPVLVGMALCVLAALVVLALVAIPRVRQGEKLLTPDGEETVRGASRRARAIATQAVDRAGEVAQDVRGRAEEARTARRRPETTEEPGVTPDRDRVVDIKDVPEVKDSDPWSPQADVRPAGAGQPAGPSAGTRTATLPARVATTAVTPADAAATQHVIDLRESPPATRAAGEPASPEAVDASATGSTPQESSPSATPRHRSPRRADAELGWGEPRPGPRHGR